MLYATEEEILWQENIDVSEQFDVLENNINIIITSYIVITKDTVVYRVSREMLQPVTPCRLISLNPWNVLSVFAFILHSNLPIEREVLTIEQTQEVIWYVNVLNQKINPFFLSQEIYLEAIRYFNNGFYREAAIFSQTGIETLFSALYMQLLMIEGKTKTQAEELKENTAFVSMVKKEFHHRLGGNWNVNDENSDIGKWYRDTYRLRNRVAHGGYFPGYDEAKAAVDMAGKV